MSPVVLTSHQYPRPAYTSGKHLEPGNKKHEENMHFHIEFFFPKQTDTFSLVLDEFLPTAPEAIYCSLTTPSFFASDLMGLGCMVVRFTGSKFELFSKHMPLYALGNSGKAYM